MSDSFSRPLSTIDAEIRSIQTLNLDAGQQLSSIRDEQARHRREIDVLVTHELYVESAVEARKAKLDRLLDERLRSQAGDMQAVT
jgi:hypothetical protein